MKSMLETIWEVLLEAREFEWTQDAQLTRSVGGGELTLYGSGAWHSDLALDSDSITILESLSPLATARRMVVAQLGQSLDGRIATRTGHSHYINGPVALTHLHRMRALVDAVIVGADTATADRPRLTVRHVSGPDPVRVVIDPRGRVPANGALFDGAEHPTRVLHLVGPEADPEDAAEHVERVRLEPTADGFTPSTILGKLEEYGLRRILVEGGAETISRFLHADALDRLHLLIAPLIIGSGRNGLELPEIDRLDEARRPRMRGFELAEELLIDVDLRNVGDRSRPGAQ